MMIQDRKIWFTLTPSSLFVNTQILSMQSWCVFKYISQKGILCLVLLESLIQRESKLLLPTSKAFSEIYCEFYDKYYIRKHLVTTCQLGDCAQLEKLTMMRPTVGQSGGEEVDKSWWKLRNWKIEVIQRLSNWMKCTIQSIKHFPAITKWDQY